MAQMLDILYVNTCNCVAYIREVRMYSIIDQIVHSIICGFYQGTSSIEILEEQVWVMLALFFNNYRLN